MRAFRNNPQLVPELIRRVLYPGSGPAHPWRVFCAFLVHSPEWPQHSTEVSSCFQWPHGPAWFLKGCEEVFFPFVRKLALKGSKQTCAVLRQHPSLAALVQNHPAKIKGSETMDIFLLIFTSPSEKAKQCSGVTWSVGTKMSFPSNSCALPEHS